MVKCFSILKILIIHRNTTSVFIHSASQAAFYKFFDELKKLYKLFQVFITQYLSISIIVTIIICENHVVNLVQAYKSVILEEQI